MIHARKAFECIWFLISLVSGPLRLNQVRKIAWVHLVSLYENLKNTWKVFSYWSPSLHMHKKIMIVNEWQESPRTQRSRALQDQRRGENSVQISIPETQKKNKGHLLISPKARSSEHSRWTALCDWVPVIMTEHSAQCSPISAVPSPQVWRCISIHEAETLGNMDKWPHFSPPY